MSKVGKLVRVHVFLMGHWVFLSSTFEKHKLEIQLTIIECIPHRIKNDPNVIYVECARCCQLLKKNTLTVADQLF